MKPRLGVGRPVRFIYSTLVALVIGALATQLLGGDVLTQLAFQTLIFIAQAASYDLFSGYTGYYNLGYGAFFAIGAYAFVLSFEQGVPFLVALALSGPAGALFAAAVSYPLFRIRGAYFAIASFGLAQLVYWIAVNTSEFTGGLGGKYLDVGSAGISPAAIVIPVYYGAAALAVVTVYVHYRLGRSKLGFALQTIREDESVAENFGINAYRGKTRALVLSGFFAGFAGAIFALNFQYVSATSLLGLTVSLGPVVMAMLGGSGFFLGPIIGAFIFAVIREILLTSLFGLQLLGFGVILLIIGLSAPAGILGLRRLRRYVRIGTWPA